MRNWRIDFATLWVVQFIAAAGFSVAGPFVPLYIQQLGVHGVREAAVWSGLMGAMGGIALAVASPVWGMIADRRGRKLMVERATIGASVFQAAMGLVSNVQELVVLRGLQSMVSGVQAAVMALAATIIPQSRLGFAMGTLQTATALGSTLGPMAGGLLAAAVGYRPTFFLTGIILCLSGVLCWAAVREQFTPPAPGAVQQRAMAGFSDVLKTPGMGGLLLVMAFSRAAGQAMSIAIPLVLQEMAGGSLEVSGTTGTVIGLTALGMALGAMIWGRLGDRVGQPRILIVCMALSAVLIIPQTFVQQPWQLAVGQMAYAFTLAGLLPSSSALIGIIGPKGRHGVVYGASGTALALGNALGPTLAAVLIGVFGTRAMFAGVGVILFSMHLVLRRMLGPAYLARSTE